MSLYKMLPFKKQICFFLKFLPINNDFFLKRLNFTGVFTVKNKSKKYFKMHNHIFLYIEKYLFWKGLFGYWEKESLKVWEKLCIEANVIFDIGANTGTYSLLAKSVNPGAKVYAFEPIKRIYQKLIDNTKLNDFDIICINKAVSNVNTKITFYDEDSPHTLTASLKKRNDLPTEIIVKPIEIDAVTIDGFAEKHNIEKIDLIKIDVETAELEVIQGLKNQIKKHRPAILIEVLNNDIAKGVKDLLKGLDYTYYDVDEEKGIKKVETLKKAHNYLICKSELVN